MNQFKLLLKEAFIQFWDERQGRERQYIIAAALAFFFFLIYLMGISPAVKGRTELSNSLPVLRQQAVQMQQMAKELQGLPRPENLFAVNREMIETSLSRNNLKAQSLSVVEGVVRVQFSSTSMAALQMWLLEMQKSSGLFVEEIKITGLDDGLVSVNLTLHQSSDER